MPLDPSLDPIFDAAAQQYNLNPALLKAVALTESSGNLTAVGPTTKSGENAGGLMQIMPGTAPTLGVNNVFDPAQAIPGAAKLLRQGIDRHGSVQGALGDYYGAPDPKYIGTVARYYAQLTAPQPSSGIAALAAAGGGPPPNGQSGSPGDAILRDSAGTYRIPQAEVARQLSGVPGTSMVSAPPQPSSGIAALAAAGGGGAPGASGVPAAVAAARNGPSLSDALPSAPQISLASPPTDAGPLPAQSRTAAQEADLAAIAAHGGQDMWPGHAPPGVLFNSRGEPYSASLNTMSPQEKANESQLEGLHKPWWKPGDLAPGDTGLGPPQPAAGVAQLAALSPQSGGRAPAAATPPASAGGDTIAQAQPDLSNAGLLSLLSRYNQYQAQQKQAGPATAAPAAAVAPVVAPAGASAPAPAPHVAVADPTNAMFPASMIPHLLTFPAGVAIAQQIQQLSAQGIQLNRDGTQSPVKGGLHDPDLLQQNAAASAAGKTLNTPELIRQGQTGGFPIRDPNSPSGYGFAPNYQSPHLPEATVTQPPPLGSPPGTPPSAVIMPGGSQAIQTASTAEEAGKAAFEPTSLTFDGRKYPVTHLQFQQLTKLLGIPGIAAAAAGAPAVPGAPPGAAPQSGMPGAAVPGAPPNAAIAPSAAPGLTGQSPGQPNIGTQVMTLPEQGRAEELGKEYAGVLDNFTHAQTSQGPLAAIRNASENFRTGPSGATRLALEKAWQDLAPQANLAPDDPLAKEIASGEIIGKSGNQLGFALSRTLGTREAASLVQQAIASNPGLANSPEGNKQLIAVIGQGLQRDIDKKTFYDNWFNTHQHSYEGAGTTFQNTAPPEQYISNVLPYHLGPTNPAADYNALKPGVKYVNPKNGNIQQKPMSAPNG